MLCIHVLCSSRGVPFLRRLLVWLLLVHVLESSPFAIGFSLVRSIPIRTIGTSIGSCRSTDRPAHNYNNNAPLSRGGGGWNNNNNNNWHTRPPSHSYVGRLVQLDVTATTDDDRPKSEVPITNTAMFQSLQEIIRRLRADLCTTAAAKKATYNNNNNNHNVLTRDDLSSDEITLLSRDLSPDEIARETLLSSRIPELTPILCSTRLGPSTIPEAGRGLFAARDISKGDVITCYPGDGLLYTLPLPSQNNDNKDQSVDDEEAFEDMEIYDEDEFDTEFEDEFGDMEDEDEEVDEIVIWGEHVDETIRWDEDAVFDGYGSMEDRGGGRPLTEYALEVCDSYTLLGVPDLDANPAYYGHFANDAAGHFAGVSNGFGVGVEEGLAAYVLESVERSNAKHRPLEKSHMVTVATRDISEGEEIFVTYGVDYWIEHSAYNHLK
eukprot:scaffold278002_cov50-Attheya_sp.AAC.1